MQRVRYLIAAVGVLLLVALPATAGAVSPPSEPTIEPVEFTSTGVKLKGTLNPGGTPTYYYFMYAQPGEEECAGVPPCGATTSREGPLSGDASQEVSAEVTGLRPGQSYIFWLFAENEAGARHSAVGWFTVPGATAGAPSIESESASHVAATGATLEATINPEDAEQGVSYQFQLITSPGKYLTEFACPTAWKYTYLCVLGDLDADAEGLPIDETGPGVEGQTVGLDLAHAGVTLKPGTTYHYRVIAARLKFTEDGFGFEGPIVYGPDETFTTLAAKAPVIESVKVSHLTRTDATLEATIDTEGLETEYAFHMISSPCSKKGAGCELIIPIKLPFGGKLFGSFEPQTVSLELNSAGVELGEGEYVFGVTASSEGGETTASGGMFEAPEEAVVEPLGSIIAPTPTAQPPGTSNDGSQSSGSGGSSSTTPGTAGALGSSSKTGAGKTGGKPRVKHAKHHKRKHHGKMAAKPAKSRKH
jgi:hypothetical protein